MKELGGGFFAILKLIGKLVPGTYLKTLIYLNCVLRIRKVVNRSICTFYCMDHIYEVLREFKRYHKGNFSILEFGVADGYSFTKKLYATRYLHMADRVIVHGFDTFEGLPEIENAADCSLVHGGDWIEGHYHGRYEALLKYCQANYNNFQLHQGLFQETLIEEFLQTLREHLPILVWIDCDYYSSAKAVFQRLIPYLPTGCVVYFDDIYFNFSSRFTGEMKAVWEINNGRFGDGIELVLDPALSWNSNRVYRFINVNQETKYQLKHPRTQDPVRRRREDSPLP